MQQNQSQLLTEKDGQALAASMLEEIQSLVPDDLDVLSMEAQYRNGKPQNNIVFKYLKAMETHGNEAVMAGFATVLTDYLACPTTKADLYHELGRGG